MENREKKNKKPAIKLGTKSQLSLIHIWRFAAFARYSGQPGVRPARRSAPNRSGQAGSLWALLDSKELSLIHI